MQKPANNDQFVCETFFSEIARDERVEWNYRDRAGELHTGTARTKGGAVAEAAKYGYLDDVIEAGEQAESTRYYASGTSGELYTYDGRGSYRLAEFADEVERGKAREAVRNAEIEAAIRNLKSAAEHGAVRSDINKALEEAGFNDRLAKVEDLEELAKARSHYAPGASKPQSIEVVAIKTGLDRNGNSRHGYLISAPLYAPLPNGDTGRFFIESPGDNLRDLFDRVPDAQWPTFEVKISRSDFNWYKSALPTPPRVATRADQIVLRGD